MGQTHILVKPNFEFGVDWCRLCA